MKNKSKKTAGLPPLDEVLDRYALEGPSLDQLKVWSERYEKYADDLAAFTDRWLEGEAKEAIPRTRADRDAEAYLVSYGLGLMHCYLDEQAKAIRAQAASDILKSTETSGTEAPWTVPRSGEVSSEKKKPVKGIPAKQTATEGPKVRTLGPQVRTLNDLVEARGSDVFDVIRRIGLTPQLWAKLVMGHFSFVAELSKLARARVIDQIAQLFHVAADQVNRLIPNRARVPAGDNRSKNRPRVQTQVEFYEALEADDKLDNAIRQFYLTGEGEPPLDTGRTTMDEP